MKSDNNPTSWELFEERLGVRFKEAQLSSKNSCQIIKDLMSKAALQMFTGIYRVFVGKSECGDFNFMGIAHCKPKHCNAYRETL